MPYRGRYKLSENKSRGLPAQVIYFDVETNFDPDLDEQQHAFRLVVGKYQRYNKGQKVGNSDVCQTTSKDKFWNWVESHVRDQTHVYLFAHNTDFDWAASDGFRQFADRGWKIKWFALDTNVWIIKYCKDNRSITVLDSLQYYRFALETLGKTIDLPKLPMPDPDESDNKWFIYCRRDVEILSQVMENLYSFIRSHDLGRFAFTISGQSVNAFRHRFMDHDIEIHRFQRILEAEKKAYRGARTEAFFVGEVPEEKIYDLDVNSMYPYVMREFDYPVKFQGAYEDPPLKHIKGQVREGCAILHAIVDVDKPAIALRESKLIFPVGRFEGWFNTAEIKWLLENDAIYLPLKLFCYQSKPIFKSFVDYFYPLKVEATKNSQKVERTNAKLILNSCYGKFAQKNPVVEKIGEVPGSVFKIEYGVSSATGKDVQFIVLDGDIFAKIDEKWATHSFPAIAGEVTANARMYLWSLIEKAGIENTYYCDTDSIFVNSTGLDRLEHLIDKYELGKLDYDKIADKCQIFGAKDYILGDTVKIKGVPYSADKLKDGKYKYTTFEQFRTRLSNNNLGQVNEKMVVKKLSRTYDKGTVTQSGKVKPLRFPL